MPKIFSARDSFTPHLSCKKGAGFTLIELLVVVSIISILAVFVIMTLNPSELLKQARDSQRVSDLDTINHALSLVQVDNTSASFGTASTTYISIPDNTATSTTQGNACTGLGLPSLPAGWAYHCSASSTYRNTDGTGWMPVNFNALSYGTPLGSLPVDPINNGSSTYYTYTAGGSWQLTATPESNKVRTTQANQTTGAITMGTNLNLSPLFNPNGLVGYWKFDEGSGATVADSSGNGNTGTLVNSPSWTTGKVGGALQFNGSTNYVNAGNASNLDVAGGDFTAGVWINTQTTAKKFFLQKADLNDGWNLGINMNADIFLELRDSSSASGTTASFPTAIATNTWYYVAVVKSGTNITVYKNGISLGTQAAYQNLSNAAVNFQIGRLDWWTPGYFIGSIDDVRLYNRALSAAEIMALYNATK